MKDEMDAARQKNLECERVSDAKRQEDEDRRVLRPFRLTSTLDGVSTCTLSRTYADFIDLLRSNEPLDEDLRKAIANALERGQIDGPGVRLKIEADGQFFRAMASMESDERLLDAGLYIAREQRKKRTISSICRDLPALFNIDDGVDYARRARKLYSHFRQWFEDKCEGEWTPNRDINRLAFEEHDGEDEDFAVAKSDYLLRRVPSPLPRYED